MSTPNQFIRVAPLYDNLMAVVPYRQWVDYVERLWARHHCRPRTVLDLACGTGSVALELARRGYEADGADLSAPMLEQARRKAPEGVRFYEQDARALQLPRVYDACVCLFDSLNYLLEEEHLAVAFRGVREHLAPGGLFVFDLNAIRALETGMFDQEGHGADRSLSYAWRSGWDAARRLCHVDMEFRLRTPSGVETIRERHVQRGYTQEEVRGLLERAGLAPLAVYEAFTFQRPTARTDRYYFVARNGDRP